MATATTILLEDEHKKKLEELVWITKSKSASEYIRNLIDREYEKKEVKNE